MIFFGNLDGFRSLRRFTCLTILEWHDILSHKMTARPQQCSSSHGTFCLNVSSGNSYKKNTSSDIKARLAKNIKIIAIEKISSS